MNDLLVYLSFIYKGNNFKIFKGLKNKIRVTKAQIQEVLDILEDNQISYITSLDENYPHDLKEIRYAPFVLFYKGNINLLKNKIICATGDVENELVNKNIDKSIENLSQNYALLTNGYKNLDQKLINLYREKNKNIIHLLASGHDFYKDYINLDKELYISQYPLGVNPKYIRFKERNIMASLLARCLIIYSSKNSSGIINLASSFANNNKEVYCYPGLSMNDGNNFLIKSGANLITQIADVSYY